MHFSIKIFKGEFSSIIIPIKTDETCVFNVEKRLIANIYAASKLRSPSIDAMPPIPADFPPLVVALLSTGITGCETVIVKRHHPATVWMMHVSPASKLSGNVNSMFITSSVGKFIPYADLSAQYEEEQTKGELTLNKEDIVDVAVIVKEGKEKEVDLVKIKKQLGCTVNHIQVLTPPKEIVIKEYFEKETVIQNFQLVRESADNQTYAVSYMQNFDTLLISGSDGSNNLVYFKIENFFEKIANNDNLEFISHSPSEEHLQGRMKKLSRTRFEAIFDDLYAQSLDKNQLSMSNRN